MNSNANAQGAIEYLLIIGAAILVVTIVAVSMSGIVGTGTENNDSESTYDKLLEIQAEDAGKYFIPLGTTEQYIYTGISQLSIADIENNGQNIEVCTLESCEDNTEIDKWALLKITSSIGHGTISKNNLAFVKDVTENNLAKYIFLITIDGMRPDRFLEANTPTIDSLIENHNTSYSFDSQTICPPYTPTGHASLLTGVVPEVHGFYDPEYPLNVNTILEIFEDNNFRTAFVDGKGGRIKGLERGASFVLGNIDFRGRENADVDAMNAFLEIFEENKPTFSFVLLPNVDYIGHQFVDSRPEYLSAIEDADKAIEVLIRRLVEKNIFSESLIVITSDHGRTGKDHGNCSLPTDMTIPIIKIGKDFEKGEAQAQNIIDISQEILDIYEIENAS